MGDIWLDDATDFSLVKFKGEIVIIYKFYGENTHVSEWHCDSS